MAAGLSLARKSFEKPRGGFGRAPAGLLESHGRSESSGRYFGELLESILRARQNLMTVCAYVFHSFGAIWRSELTFSYVLGPSNALAARLCCQIAQGPVELDPRSVVFYRFLALGGEPLRRGYKDLIPDTVYLLLDT